MSIAGKFYLTNALIFVCTLIGITINVYFLIPAAILFIWFLKQYIRDDDESLSVRSVEQCRSIKDEHATAFDHDYVSPNNRLKDR